MPHAGSSSSSTEDLASSDEIKVFKDEGDERVSADLTDIKSSLITEGDQEKGSQAFSSKSSNSQQSSTHPNGHTRLENAFNLGRFDPLGYPFGYPPSPYYPNGTFNQMANQMAAVAGMQPPFILSNLGHPPPAHMGHLSGFSAEQHKLLLEEISRKQIASYNQHYLNELTQHFQQFQNPMYTALRASNSYLPSSSTFSSLNQAAFMSLQSHGPFTPNSFLSSASSANSALSNDSFGMKLNNSTSSRNGSSLGIGLLNGRGTTSSGSSSASPNAGLLINGHLNPSAISAAAAAAAAASIPHHHHHHNNNNNDLSIRNKNRGNISNLNGNTSDSSTSSTKLKKDNSMMLDSPHSEKNGGGSHSDKEHSNASKMGHVKKPLNAFMIYMKEMRAQVIAEEGLKESAQINQRLGKRWQDLPREEQEIYFVKARAARQLHMELHPGWTAKDNYAVNGKKKKKKRERNLDGERGAMKKCRARYGLEQQSLWCKPCKRKKKCIAYLESRNCSSNRTENDDNLGSVGSVEVPTPESIDLSLIGPFTNFSVTNFLST